MFPSLLGDIHESKPFKRPPAGSRPTAPASGLLLVPPVRVEVPRGRGVDIPVIVSPRTAGVRVEVLERPSHGILERIDDRPGAAAVFRYTHDRDSADPEDGFTFLLSDAFSSTVSRQKARILISNPKADIAVDPEGIVEFGKIPIGSSSTNEVTLVNRFGSPLQGTLHVAKPWRILGDPEINLTEGSPRKVSLVFAPEAEGDQSSRLTIDPSPEPFPEVRLSGSGLAPFLYLGPNPLVTTGENPGISMVLSNACSNPVSVRLGGVPREIPAPAFLNLPPLGTGTLDLSLAPLKIPDQGVRKYRIALAFGTYMSHVDLILMGRKAEPVLELLHPDTSAARIGRAMEVEGIVRNPSDDARSVEIALKDHGSPGAALAELTESIPPGNPFAFRMNWVPAVAGRRKLDIELREHGRLLDRQELNVTVLPPAPDRGSAPETTLVPKQAIPGPGNARDPRGDAGEVRIASQKERDMAVLDLNPSVEQGILRNHLCLNWRYYGDSPGGFVVETLRQRNGFSDRTAMEEAETWCRVGNVTPRFENGVWTARFAMPWPGNHSYRVYPASKGQILVCNLSLTVTNAMFWWPALRALALVTLTVLLVKYIRRRDWGRLAGKRR